MYYIYAYIYIYTYIIYIYNIYNIMYIICIWQNHGYNTYIRIKYLWKQCIREHDRQHLDGYNHATEAAET